MTLPSNDLLTFTPSELVIPLTNVEEILNSINFTVSLNTQQNGTSNNIMTILLPDGFNLRVSLAGMDINKFFYPGKSKSIL